MYYDTAIVMAASRLSNLDTNGVPKCLIHIGERPLIHHVIQQLWKIGIKKIIVTLGYEAEKIQKYLEENNVFEGVTLHFVKLPESIWAVRGSANSILSAKLVVNKII